MRNWVIIIGLLLLLSCGEVGKSSKYAEVEILSQEVAWDEEFGTPIDFINPPEMPEEYKSYPRAIYF